MQKLTKEEFLDKFDAIIYPMMVSALRQYPDAIAFVVAENVALDSSALGERSAILVGPSNTYTTIEECEGKYLNDLPSQRQYFTSYLELLDRAELELVKEN